MSVTLSGNIPVRNGDSLDYCWREAAASLLPVCDEVMLVDGDSDDGTTEAIKEWSAKESKIKHVRYPWPNPHNHPDFFVEWINFGREHCRCDFQIELDSDEAIFESSYPHIEAFKKRTSPGAQVALWCHRWNFFKDPQHLIPQGVCCGHKVCRVGPSSVWMPSDGPHPRAQELIRLAQPSLIEIGHYGFLRKSKAFIQKNRALLGYFFGTQDERINAAESFDGPWYNMPGICGGWENNLVPYVGDHSEVIKPWLRERNFSVA